MLAMSSIAIFPISFYALNSPQNVDNNSIRENNDLKLETFAVPNVTETATTFTFKANANIPWAGTKFANEVTPEDLVLALQPAVAGASYFVTIEPISATDLQNGTVRFKLYQNLRTFTNGIQTAITQQLIQNTSATPASDIWSTPTNLVKSQKYQFGWKSDKEIGEFISTSNKKFSELTKEDIYNNLLDSTLNLPPFSSVNVNFSDLASSTNSRGTYGVGNVNVTFTGINNSDWASGTAPTGTTKVLRGVLTNANTREVMGMQFSADNISTRALSQPGLTEYSVFLMNTASGTFGDLFASQFLSANNGSNQTLIDIMTKGLYSTNTSPLASLSYMGKNINDADFFSVTGLDKTALETKLKIESIEPSINDAVGSLSLIYNFTYYDIFTNEVLSGTALQNFANGSFKVNPDAGKNLIFEWKANEMVAGSDSFAGIGTSFDVVNNYYVNKDNEEYLIDLSNQFFTGSTDTYTKSRKVTIDYLGGGTIDALTNTYVPTVLNQKSIVVTITFDTWNGNIYTDADGNKQYGFTASKTFTLKEYNYVGLETITWTSQSSLFNQYPFLNTISPSDVAYEVSRSIGTGETRFIDKEAFYSISGFNDTTDSMSVIFYPNDATGVIEIRIYVQQNNLAVGSQRVYSQFFSGFKKVTNSTTVEFGWVPQSQVSGQLLNQNIEDVSIQNVIDFYLINIPLFKDSVLSADNVSIEIDPNNSSRLLVYVTIPLFNQDQVNPGTQTFVTSISGFGRVESSNVADFTAPDNYTVLISVLLVSVIAVTTGVVLLTLLIKQFSVRRVKTAKLNVKNKKTKVKK